VSEPWQLDSFSRFDSTPASGRHGHWITRSVVVHCGMTNGRQLIPLALIGLGEHRSYPQCSAIKRQPVAKLDGASAANPPAAAAAVDGRDRQTDGRTDTRPTTANAAVALRRARK